MKLIQGARYKATIELGFFEKFATNETITGKLRDAGFTSVTTWGEGGLRFATGIWPGATQDAAVPKQVTKVEIIG